MWIFVEVPDEAAPEVDNLLVYLGKRSTDGKDHVMTITPAEDFTDYKLRVRVTDIQQA